jgi:hypothetical protein
MYMKIQVLINYSHFSFYIPANRIHCLIVGYQLNAVPPDRLIVRDMSLTIRHVITDVRTSVIYL